MAEYGDLAQYVRAGDAGGAANGVCAMILYAISFMAMSKADKTLDRMRNNPRDCRIESLEAVAARFGITVRKPAGSHVVFQHEESVISVTVPAHRPIKPVYVKQFLALVDDVRS